MSSTFDQGTLVFVGDRKRFSTELYRQTPGLEETVLFDFRPLFQLIEAPHQVIHDVITHQVNSL